MPDSLPVRVAVEAVPIAGDTYGKRVTWDTFRLPGGAEERFLLLDADVRPCLVFPVTEAGEVVALRHFRYAANAEIWELPGGALRLGRSLEEGARQELLEETGYAAGRLMPLSAPPVWFDPGTYKVAFTPFLALDCRKVAEPTPGPTEKLSVHPMALQRWLALVAAGEVADAKTLAITLLALPHLGLVHSARH